MYVCIYVLWPELSSKKTKTHTLLTTDFWLIHCSRIQKYISNAYIQHSAPAKTPHQKQEKYNITFANTADAATVYCTFDLCRNAAAPLAALPFRAPLLLSDSSDDFDMSLLGDDSLAVFCAAKDAAMRRDFLPAGDKYVL